MRIECIAIGTELLTTRRVDTNSVWLGERLADLGLGFHRKTAVGDSREDLAALFREALTRSDLILTTGGLGPTFDDFTKELFAEIMGTELREDSTSREDMLAFYAARKRTPPQVNFKQALIPEGAEALRNPVGTAPGVWWQDPPSHPGVRIVMMPGVPREMKRMWTEQVEPRLSALIRDKVHTLRLVVTGVPESTLDERTKEARERHAHLDWTILASLTEVELLARGTDPAALDAALADFRQVLGPDLATVGNGHLEDAVLEGLRGKGQTLAVAESMTGGLLCSRLTAVPGASQALRGGVTAYTATAKTELLGLDAAWLQEVGTVSEPCAAALAESARQRLKATWGLGICGNAGPDAEGGEPVGALYIAIAGPNGTTVKPHRMVGDRAEIQLRATALSLDLLRRAVAQG